ncbi:hypothetical protein OKA04_01305 [Luteolibacter flavescens]|uniref:Uncharacterized protein n=1 Tax=Luteolibacter flavescens TaxID=1859460 RepID=A0ABT3FIF0_9BACT|nr:hypothetical protein [Luteolibacter flavescens]MCW1883346.1 hypothetical protein [Luteolibacter flavescens]
MKPNLLVINPSGSEPAPWMENLCNQWMEENYVYLLCPGCGFREDNDQGVRFLPHAGAAVPRFGHLDAVIAFEESDFIEQLKLAYPDVLVRVIARSIEGLPEMGAVPASREQSMAA